MRISVSPRKPRPSVQEGRENRAVAEGTFPHSPHSGSHALDFTKTDTASEVIFVTISGLTHQIFYSLLFLDEQIELLSTDITHSLMTLEPGTPPTPAAQAADGKPDAPDTSTAPLSFARAVSVLDTIPGVDQRGAELLVAEWGTDITRFAAWTGVAPGNEESAGKQRSGKTRQGNRALRTGLTQMAHAATRTKGTYVSALYHRLAARRGKKRAMIAVAHAIVVSAFHMLSRHEPYHELGANHFDRQRRHHLVDRFTRRLEHLGYRVSLEPVSAL